MNIQELLNQYTPKLSKISSTPQLDVGVVLSFVLNKPKEFLYTHPEYQLTTKQLTKFKKFINRRLKNEPIAYITGQKEFYDLNFIANKDVLIPRPDTEIMVEEVLTILRGSTTLKVSTPLTLIDIGTGSGCIPIAIAKSLPKEIYQKTKIYATDISQKTLNIAKQNLQKHRLSKKIKLLQGDLLEPFFKVKTNVIEMVITPPSPPCQGGSVDFPPDRGGLRGGNNHFIITANLPYIPTRQYNTLSKDIINYEPKEALVAGPDGLKYYKKLFKQIKKFIQIYSPESLTLLIEIEPFQVKLIKKILKQNSTKTKIEITENLAKLDRIIIIQFK